MLLVDRVEALSEEQIVCFKTFRPDEYFLQGHFPVFPLVPGVILCECALQAGAILLAKISQQVEGEMLPVATRLDAVKFKQMVRPGDTVKIEVSLNDSVGAAYFLTGKVTVNTKLAARLDFACTMTPKPA